MSIKLNRRAIEHAKKLIEHGEVEFSQKWNWSTLQPDRSSEARFLDTHYSDEYGQWFLAVDTDAPKNSVEHYKYPVGDLSVIYKTGVEEAARQAKKDGHEDVAQAAEEILNFIDKTEH